MKALFLHVLFLMFFVQSNGQDKQIHDQFYRYNSTCYFTYTKNVTSILTLYTDSSFLLEIFNNQFQNGTVFTKSSFFGTWVKYQDKVELKYTSQETESFSSNSSRSVYAANSFVLSLMPINCIILNDEIKTDSKILPVFDRGKSKVLALSEKLSFENLAKKKKAQPIKFNTLSISSIKNTDQ